VNEEKAQKEQESSPVCRAVVEFVGVGMADVKRAEFQNMSLGQMMALAQYVQWQCDRAIMRFEHQQAQKAKQNKIVVPRGMVQ